MTNRGLRRIARPLTRSAHAFADRWDAVDVRRRAERLLQGTDEWEIGQFHRARSGTRIARIRSARDGREAVLKSPTSRRVRGDWTESARCCPSRLQSRGWRGYARCCQTCSPPGPVAVGRISCSGPCPARRRRPNRCVRPGLCSSRRRRSPQECTTPRRIAHDRRARDRGMDWTPRRSYPERGGSPPGNIRACDARSRGRRAGRGGRGGDAAPWLDSRRPMVGEHPHRRAGARDQRPRGLGQCIGCGAGSTRPAPSRPVHAEAA